MVSSKDYLRVVTTVGSQGLGDDEESIGESLDAELGSSFDFSFVLQEGVRGGDFESASSRHHGAIFQRVLDGAQSVANGVLQLRQRVLVGALREERKETMKRRKGANVERKKDRNKKRKTKKKRGKKNRQRPRERKK